MAKKNSRTSSTITLPTERIVRSIHLIRGHKVLLDSDIAELYGTETKVLVQ